MQLTLRRDTVALRHSVRAASQRHDERTRLYMSLVHDDIVGYGEIDPQPFALNGDPGIGEVIQELDGFVLSQLQTALEREGALPSWSRFARFAGSRSSSAPAVTLVEMALLDRELRGDGHTIEELWPARFATPLQATVSLLDDESEWNFDASVARLRVKTAPGGLSAVARSRLESLSVPVLVDFNCSATNVQQVTDHVAFIRAHARIAAVEQPFAPGNVIEHALLARRIDEPISLDEGLRSQRDLEQIVRYGAARMVCVKPARVGGYANARTLIERAVELGLTPYVGGFFESPFARHVNTVLSQHLVREPSDLGSASAQAVESLDRLEGGFGWAPSHAVLERTVLVASFG